MGDDFGIESPKDKSIIVFRGDLSTHEFADKVFPMTKPVSPQWTVQEFADELHSLVAQRKSIAMSVKLEQVAQNLFFGFLGLHAHVRNREGQITGGLLGQMHLLLDK